MALPSFINPQTIGLAVSLGSGLANVLRGGGPDFPLGAADVNKQIDLQLNRALSQVASDTRRRLIGAGQEGSGTINTAIADAQSRVRGMFEEQRSRLLQAVNQGQFQAEQAQFQQTGQTLGDFSSLGLSTFLLGGGLQDDPVSAGVSNQFDMSTYVRMLASGAGLQRAAQTAAPVQKLPTMGLPQISSGFTPMSDPRLRAFPTHDPDVVQIPFANQRFPQLRLRSNFGK